MSAGQQCAASNRLRRHPPAGAVPPKPTLQLELVGELLHDAQVRIEPCTMRACISLQIAQAHDEYFAVHATLWFGDGRESVFDAEERAADLRKGQRVRITGEGLRYRWADGTLVLSVVTVCRVELAYGTQP